MEYSYLSTYSFNELKKMAADMELPSRKSKIGYISDIKNAFNEYEKYKKNKVDKYTKIKQLGNKGQEGITYLVKDIDNKEFAMKTFRKNKSSEALKREYYLQKKASKVGISPRVVEYDSVSKYIVMEKMDVHLIDVMTKQQGNLSRSQQYRIIDIFNKLDSIKVFHGDSNILNYMVRDNIIYIIDFGLSKEITQRIVNNLGTNTPNIYIMTLGLILKLKEMNCPSTSWKYLKKYISEDNIKKFNL